MCGAPARPDGTRILSLCQINARSLEDNQAHPLSIHNPSHSNQQPSRQTVDHSVLPLSFFRPAAAFRRAAPSFAPCFECREIVPFTRTPFWNCFEPAMV